MTRAISCIRLPSTLILSENLGWPVYSSDIVPADAHLGTPASLRSEKTELADDIQAWVSPLHLETPWGRFRGRNT